MAKESKTHLQQQGPKLVIIVFLFLREGVRQRPAVHSGFCRLNGYHGLGHLIAFPPTGNGRKSLFLLPLPVKSGGRKGQESVRDPSAPGYCSMDTNCTPISWKLCGLLLWEEAEAKSLLLWLIDLTLGLLSRICHAKSDLLSASSRVLFWQHFLKLDFKCILGVLSESFIMRVQLFRLKRQCR